MRAKFLKPEPFIESWKGEVHGFWDLVEVELGLNRDDVIINLIIN